MIFMLYPACNNAQVIELRRQLACYEELTKTAANELSEIRRLKEAFHGRLQRENAALRQQLAAAGLQPLPAGAVQQHHHQQQQQLGGGGVQGGPRGAGAMAGGSVGGAFGSPAPVPPPSTGRPPRTSLSGIPTPGGVGGAGGAAGTSAGGSGGSGSVPGSAFMTPLRPPQLQLPRESPSSSCSSLPQQSPRQPQGASGGGGTAGGGGGVELDPGSAAFAAKLEAMEGVVRGLMQVGGGVGGGCTSNAEGGAG